MSVLEAPQFMNEVLDGKQFSRYWQRWLSLLPTYLNPFVTYAPVITAGSGAFTTVSATGRYRIIGKLVFIQITVTITTNGTAATQVNVTLPFASVNVAGVNHVIPGRATAVSGKMLQGIVGVNSAVLAVVNYDNSYPGASGETLVLSGFYEIA
jgi:hypothetical protein